MQQAMGVAEVWCMPRSYSLAQAGTALSDRMALPLEPVHGGACGGVESLSASEW
jgi:hypothetical protein